MLCCPLFAAGVQAHFAPLTRVSGWDNIRFVWFVGVTIEERCELSPQSESSDEPAAQGR